MALPPFKICYLVGYSKYTVIYSIYDNLILLFLSLAVNKSIISSREGLSDSFLSMDKYSQITCTLCQHSGPQISFLTGIFDLNDWPAMYVAAGYFYKITIIIITVY